jgi:hypothetical protein
MPGLLRRLLGGGEPAPAPRQKLLEPAPVLVLRTDTSLPIVDWDAMDPQAPATDDAEKLDAFWTSAARAWLEQLAQKLGTQFLVRESDHFLLMSALPEPQARVTLEFADKTHRRILRLLDGIARGSEIGKVCILVLDTHDRYYEYVSHYYPEGGEFPISGGMFLQYGYGHFVFVESQMSSMEPTIAHEHTHCLMQHLPLPAWLNEGIAVNTEHRLCPPGRPLHPPDEMHEKHLAFWNESTIQEFWSGKSWGRPDEGNSLSYDLARIFVEMLARDYDSFRRFTCAADFEDGGRSAAVEHLGFPLENLAEAVLGEGPWQPRPEAWKEGTERGQFRPS